MTKHLNGFEGVARVLLYIVAGMLPLWFVPWPAGVEGGREVSFAVIILLATVFWLFSVLSTGEIRFQLSPVLYASGLFLVVLCISAFLSSAPTVSIWFADSIGEKVFTILLGFLLMVLIGSLFHKEDVKRFVFVFLTAGAVSALINLLQVSFDISIYRYISSFAAGQFFNVIGTQNSLAIFYVLGLAIALGILTTEENRKWEEGVKREKREEGDGRWLRRGIWLAVILFLTNILFINFRTAWIVLLGVSVFLFGFISKNAEERDDSRRLDWRGWTIMGFLTISAVMILARVSLAPQLNLPAEVSPSTRATLDIGAKVFKEGPRAIFFGSGPGTFGIDWGKYKDSSINQTVFWGFRFSQGSSWATTMIPTTGILGFGSFLLFVFSGLYLFLKQIFIPRQDEPLTMALLLGYIALLISAFLYSASLFMVLALFAMAGILSSVLSREHADGGEKMKDIWVAEDKRIKFTSPWAVFLSSLSIIFVIALVVTGLYMEAGKIRAAFAFQGGLNGLNSGKIDEATAEFEKTTMLDENNFRNYQLLVQVRMEKIKDLMARSLRGENVQQEFQGVMTTAIQNAQTAIQLNPVEPLVWRVQGSLYELIIPLVNGSERFAFDSYKKAAELEPANPVIWVELGRAGLTSTDKLLAVGNQASGKDKEQINQLRASVLKEVEQAFQKAVALKSDYAPAHFLLAQTALRQGNAQEAIRNVENAKLSAPFDIGIAFQLGLLYYQNNDLNRARTEFERAISINNNYSNARYFLGLVYDRQGNQTKAVEQFKKVLELNPDNPEVQKILGNLENSRDALAGIAPPGTPPEKRNTAPVEEKDEAVKPRMRRR